MQFQAHSVSNWALIKVKAPSTSNRAPVHLCCVIDVSGSMMHDNKLDNVKHSLHFLLDFLGPNDKITLITFSNSAYTFLSNVFVTPFEKENIRARISIMKPETSTNISAGLIECIEALRHNADQEKQGILLLTDGEANLGVTDTKQLITLADSITVYRHASISCIGYGAEHNTELLRGISTKCSGSYYMVHNLDDVAKVFGDVLGGLMSCFYQTMRVVVPVGTVVKTRYPFMDSTVHIGDLPAEMEAIILAQLPVGSTVLLKGYDLTKKDSIAMECVVEANYDAADQLNGTAHILRFEVIELLDRFVALKGHSKHRAHHAHNYEKEFIADLDACKARIEAHKAQQYHVLWDILIKELVTCQRALHSNEPVDYTTFTQHGECLGLLRGMSSTDSDGQGYQFSNGLQRELSDQLHYNVTHTQEKEPLLSQSRQESVLGPPLLQARQTQDYEPLFPVAAHPSDLSNPSNPFDDMYDATPALNSNSENSPIMMRSNTCLDESIANKIYQVIPAVIPANISTNTFAPLVRHYNM
jgi:hypothetical protein